MLKTCVVAVVVGIKSCVRMKITKNQLQTFCEIVVLEFFGTISRSVLNYKYLEIKYANLQNRLLKKIYELIGEMAI